MNKVDRKKIAVAIQAGIPHLWNGRGESYNDATKSSFVCFAIDRALGVLNPDGNAAQKMIHERIAPYSLVEGWLRSQGVKNITKRKIQAYRKAWMKSMVEEFSK